MVVLVREQFLMSEVTLHPTNSMDSEFPMIVKRLRREFGYEA